LDLGARFIEDVDSDPVNCKVKHASITRKSNRTPSIENSGIIKKVEGYCEYEGEDFSVYEINVGGKTGQSRKGYFII